MRIKEANNSTWDYWLIGGMVRNYKWEMCKRESESEQWWWVPRGNDGETWRGCGLFSRFHGLVDLVDLVGFGDWSAWFSMWPFLSDSSFPSLLKHANNVATRATNLSLAFLNILSEQNSFQYEQTGLNKDRVNIEITETVSHEAFRRPLLPRIPASKSRGLRLNTFYSRIRLDGHTIFIKNTK